MYPTLVDNPGTDPLWGPTVPYQTIGGVASLLATMVEQSPNAPAATDEFSTLTYKQLWAASGRVASDLQAEGVLRGDLVAVAAPRGIPWLVGIVGCWRCGAIYLPLDPTYPPDRRAAIRADSPTARILKLDTLQRTLADSQSGESSIRDPLINGTSPAYRIYTSGSTGQPKGVTLAHEGLGSLWAALRFHLNLQPCDKVGQFASPHFDASIFEVLLAWSAGATLVLVPDTIRSAAGAGLRTWLADQAITVACLTPTLLGTIPAGPLPKLHTVLVAGEACPAVLASRWGRGRRFYNLGGVTEGTVWQTIGGPSSDGTMPPLGHPVANWRLKLTDPQDPNLAAPSGEVGELWIGGPGVALGYTNASLTAERFCGDLNVPGLRWYRTGDLVRLDSTGNLQWVGRSDEQVKLGGQRVELAEITAALMSLPDVCDATTQLWPLLGGGVQLVGYLVAAHGCKPLLDRVVRQSLAGRLPPAWRPTQLVWLPKLSRTPHDKIDSSALPRPSIPTAPTPPTLDELLLVLTELQTLLELPETKLTPTTNLFGEDVGGDSLFVLNLVVALSQRWGLPITMEDIYDSPTPNTLLERLTTLTQEDV